MIANRQPDSSLCLRLLIIMLNFDFFLYVSLNKNEGSELFQPHNNTRNGKNLSLSPPCFQDTFRRHSCNRSNYSILVILVYCLWAGRTRLFHALCLCLVAWFLSFFESWTVLFNCLTVCKLCILCESCAIRHIFTCVAKGESRSKSRITPSVSPSVCPKILSSQLF